MHRRLLTLFAIAGLAIAGEKAYTVNLYQPAILGGTELKAGEYRLELDGAKAVLRAGKSAVEAPVKVENADAKFATTSIRLTESAGKQRIAEIRLGGTRTRLVFSSADGRVGGE